jgi:hypothetical protein
MSSSEALKGRLPRYSFIVFELKTQPKRVSISAACEQADLKIWKCERLFSFLQKIIMGAN